MGEKVTALDVAEQAGVSRSAVSRVFTPGASVSKRTADKVRQAADALGYRPNVLARSLITGRSRIIGLVVAYLENQFYPEAIERLSRSLQERGYHVLVFMASNSGAEADEVMEELLDYQVDGIIVASVGMSNDLTQRCEAAGIPIVLFNRAQDDDRLSAVTSDNYHGGRKLAEFLVAGGHSRIAHIAGWDGASTQRDREAGFVAGLKNAGQTLAARAAADFNFDKAKTVARAMFQAKDRPDAVFVANDHMAFAVMDVLRYELALSVPDDVSVVGYDDVTLSAWPSYDLTTVRQPACRMVAATVEILMDRLADPETRPRRVALDGPLILRSSARIPKGWTA
ncbi:MAG: LacI family DNA-binding transcriptional regulator [Tateyamaria sp.]|jgi:DNA-binding LacI/PurR family transcriptional regulator|nr:LacI family DNA-binding transcriptional regulator [Tateyamaria sp.]MDB2578882.1 LacI family DNA-binding transcriptional regulator [Tateyamaria sp.]MDG1181903.1 LacI family DNA-binding transcriptional regulator [Tateyamaria sp.]MDG1335327.1 LacI family DNA-binding transcriptional regulator [Tateyamaria sp.]MDG2057910.1 LacI family DNA-binding transcriptional regulator [Tateyamaria sp.]